MRIHEFTSEDEWQRLELLIYATTWKALSTYQQQQATQQRIATKPAATLQPKSAKKAKALARKAKQPPHVAPPRPLPKPQHIPQAKAEATLVYRPIKTVKPLPPTTRMAMAKPQPVAKTTAPSSIAKPNEVDQAARRMLPAEKRGPNVIDLI